MCKFTLKMPTWVRVSLFFEAWGWNFSYSAGKHGGKVDWKFSSWESRSSLQNILYLGLRASSPSA